MILQPRLTYASIVWWSRVKQKRAMEASKSSPATALGAIMGLEPLHLTITAEAGKAVLRIGENFNTLISKKLRTTANIAKRPIMRMVRGRTSPRYLFDKKYKVSLSTIEDWKVSRAHLLGDGDNWFADGSKTGRVQGLVSMGRTTTQAS